MCVCFAALRKEEESNGFLDCVPPSGKTLARFVNSRVQKPSTGGLGVRRNLGSVARVDKKLRAAEKSCKFWKVTLIREDSLEDEFGCASV